MADFTPMMKQYLDVKKENQDAILFYRLGDFYEMFFDDAKLASKELDLALTGRDCGQEERAPMCGVPYHSAEGYIARLIAKGYKVAICEQMEDPALAKGLVKREIVRTVTPGTAMAPSMLEEGKNNFIASVWADSTVAGLCFCDLSTGEMSATEVVTGDYSRVMDELAKYGPSEVLLSDSLYSAERVLSDLRDKGVYLQHAGESRFILEKAEEELEKQFGEDFDVNFYPESIVRAAGGLLSYLHETQKNGLAHLKIPQLYSGEQFMGIDSTARRNLELTSTMRGEKKGSLLWVMDDTQTAAGSRLLRQWIEKPLMNPEEIYARQDAVQALMKAFLQRDELRKILGELCDMERVIGRVVFGSAGGRDLRALCEGCKRLPGVLSRLENLPGTLFGQLRRDLDLLDDISTLIDEAIVDTPPFSVREGGIIRDGYSQEVDSLRELLNGGAGQLAAIEARERERTGIKNLKVSYNKVFGYYIEVSRSNTSLVPEDYIRKQTLVSSERYITPELKTLEGEVLSAREKVVALEYELFSNVRVKVAREVTRVQKTASALAQIDVLCAFASVAEKNSYVRPKVDASDVIDIREGRHPVVEKLLQGSYFVPNDTYMDNGDNRAMIITGPNMAGKSTYMRQVALIAIMAQCGSFVPASAARLGVVDKIFTRVGASDDIGTGRSTFMVEMSEVAFILKNATKRSLLVLDEIGRGTSTFDGMAIARAVLEYVSSKRRLGAKTLFATHYHELCDMESVCDGVKNYSVVVKKRGEEIVFIKKIVRGGADDSYGVDVARLAGLPKGVINRAKEILREAENGSPASHIVQQRGEDEGQLSMGALAGSEIIEELKSLDVNVLTPIEAMGRLFDLCKRAKEC